MMKPTVALKIAAGFALTLAVFLVVSLASYRTASDLIRWSDLRQKTYLALDALDEPLALLQEVEVGTRSYYLTQDERFLERVRQAQGRLPAVVPQIRDALDGDAFHPPRLAALERLIAQRLQVSQDTLALFRNQGHAPTVSKLKSGESESLSEQIRSLVGEMQAHEQRKLDGSREQAEATAQGTRSTILWGTVSAIVLAVLAGWLITRDLSRPLAQLTAAAERITAGDTEARIDVRERHDEVGVLAQAFGRMTAYLRGMANSAEQLAAGNLRATVAPQSQQDVLGQAFQRMSQGLREQIREIMAATTVLGTSATQIVASTAQLASSASESAAAVAQTTATVEEVRQTAELAAQKARQVSDTAHKAVQDSVAGRQAAHDVGSGMERIRQQMDAIVASMGRLSESSQAIGQIIASVDDLSVQSNLLAVNAAIEAAKAGEHGKGFAVVAQEVRSLAGQSRQATGEVRKLLGDIQAAPASAMTAIQQGGLAVEAGGRETIQATGSIDALSGSIHEAAQAATQIAVSSQQQLVGMDQVATAMDNIRQASGHNMASARDLEDAARRLEEMGQRLQQIVARYTV